MRWTQERLGTIRAYVFGAVVLLLLITYFIVR